MRRILLLTGLFLLPISLWADEKQVVEINIEGMSCKICANSVRRNLSTLPDVVKATVSFNNKKAHIQMAPGKNADVAQLKKKISESGFTPAKVTIGTDD